MDNVDSTVVALEGELARTHRLLADSDLSWAVEDALRQRAADLAEMVAAETAHIAQRTNAVVLE